MAPSTITETSLLSETVQNKIPSKYELDNNTKNNCEKGRSVNKISPYYDTTLSPTDPKFLAGLRQWEKSMGFVTSIRWTSAIPISLFHIICVAWLLYNIAYDRLPKWQTGWFAVLLGQMAGFGVTGGVHRLWTHRSYKAKLPLQIVLLTCYSIAGQNNVYNWVRDHRLHHKLTETSADPHDARRGFFFSHVGWLMMKKHPHVLQEGAKIDMSDIANDPLLRFYDRYFDWFKLAFCAILPTVICVVAWDEEWITAIYTQVLLRYMLSLNFTWSVNSFAHLWGYKPYDPNIMPGENLAPYVLGCNPLGRPGAYSTTLLQCGLVKGNIMPGENLGVSILAMGEGWHNYHHTFPWDYKAAELSYFVNVTTILLDLFAKIGWVYDVKKASPKLIQAFIDKNNSKHVH